MSDGREETGGDESSTDRSASDEWTDEKKELIETDHFFPPTDAVVISADCEVFDVHSVVLASVSPFFRALFAGHFQEARRRCVHLKLLSSKQIHQIIRFAYTGQLQLDASTALTVLDWATFSMIDDLADQCVALLIRHLTVDNCISIYRFAEVRRLDLASAAWRTLIRRFDQVARTPALQLLNENELLRLYGEEQLNATDDAHERRILDTWLAHNADRASSAAKLRSAIDSRRVAGVRRPRTPNSVLLSICGWAHTGPTPSIETFDIRADRWVLADAVVSNTVARAYHGIVTVGSSVYVMGGFNGTVYYRSVRHFDMNTQVWSERGPMHEKRCYVGCSALDDGHLMAIGGYNGEGKRMNSVEVYDVGRNQWSLVGAMKKQRSDSHAVNIDGRVYMVGGFDGNFCEQSVEFYDPHKDTWYSTANMKHVRSGVGASRIDGILFAVGGYDGAKRLDSVEMFDPREGEWHLAGSMSRGRSNFGIESIEGDLIVAGGYDGGGITALCERYDKRAVKWSPAPMLNVGRSALYVTLIEEHDIIRSLCYLSTD